MASISRCGGSTSRFSSGWPRRISAVRSSTNMRGVSLILSRLPATLEITLAAVIGATLLGVPLGMYAGYRPDSVLSKSIMAVSVLGFSLPTFWIG